MNQASKQLISQSIICGTCCVSSQRRSNTQKPHTVEQPCCQFIHKNISFQVLTLVVRQKICILGQTTATRKQLILYWHKITFGCEKSAGPTSTIPGAVSSLPRSSRRPLTCSQHNTVKSDAETSRFIPTKTESLSRWTCSAIWRWRHQQDSKVLWSMDRQFRTVSQQLCGTAVCLQERSMGS